MEFLQMFMEEQLHLVPRFRYSLKSPEKNVRTFKINQQVGSRQ